MAILVDWSQIVISHYFSQEKIQGVVNDDDFRKHVLHTLMTIHGKHKYAFGNIIICCDGDKSWRYDVYPHYKAIRKLNRADDAIKWKEIYRLNTLIRDEIAANHVFPVVTVSRAEADDIIAVLCKTLKDPTLIISEDRDFHQLHELSYVHQYSHKKASIYHIWEPDAALKEKIIRGDRNDSIPNIRSADDALILKVRQKPITDSLLKKYSEHFYVGGEGIPEEYAKNFERNKILIDFNYIPDDVTLSILEVFGDATKRRGISAAGTRTMYLVQSGLRI